MEALAASSIRRISYFLPQDITNTAWSFASLGVQDQPLMHAIAASALRSISDFNAQDLSNMAWSVAKLAFSDAPLLYAIAAKSRAMITEAKAFSVQHLANIAWSCASLGVHDGPLLTAIASSAIPKLSLSPTSFRNRRGQSDTSEGPVAALALAQALAAAGALDGALAAPFLGAVAGTLRHWGATLDSEAAPVQGISVPSSGDNEPHTLFCGDHFCAFYKPPGWTVAAQNTERDVEMDDVPSEGRPLQDWLALQLGQNCPIALDARRQHGAVHRLDRGTSGVLLCAITYQGYYAAQLSFATRQVTKDYLCLCHGHVASGFPRLLEAPLQVVGRPGARRSTAASGGLRACTELLAAAQLGGPEGDCLSLVSVSLHTGRLHQIRVHLSQEGHPLVGDVTYGGYSRPWCARIFLHALRLRLDPRPGGVEGPLDIRSPLPQDLMAALRRLTPVDGPSRVLVDRMLSCSLRNSDS